MTENLSEIAKIFEQLGKSIVEYKDENDVPLFQDIPVRWDMCEVSPNNMNTTEIVLQGKPFQRENNCVFERQLDIIIIHNTDYERDITLRLSKYSEDMIKIIDDIIMSGPNYELQFLQGSEIRYLRNNKEDAESYKGSKTLFSSMIVLSYLLRY
jgi:hypothetical protein